MKLEDKFVDELLHMLEAVLVGISDKEQCLDLYRRLASKCMKSKSYAFFDDMTLMTNISGHKVNVKQYKLLVQLMRDDRKINAIKEFRSIAGIGLKEAKYAMDDFQMELGLRIPAPPDANHTDIEF